MRTLHLIILYLLCVACFAQRTERVKTTVTYRAGGFHSPEEAKLMAVEYAKTFAIDSLFGTNISNISTDVAVAGGGQGAGEFLEFSNLNVRGRWIKDLHEPVFGDIRYVDNRLNVTVTVSGIVREIKNAPIECKVKILCDGTSDRFERTDFNENSKLYLSFTAPVDGYLVVYLVDNKLNAFCALPYFNQDEGAYRIQKDKEYIFFSKNDAPASDREFAEEYYMTADSELETNQLYVVFSPNKFTKPVGSVKDKIRTAQLPWKEFQAWLSKCMNHDDEMTGEVPYIIHIKK